MNNEDTPFNRDRNIDIKLTLENLITTGKLEECMANMIGVIIHIDGVCDLLNGLKKDGVLFPESPDEFRDEFDELISSMKNLINDAIYPNLVQADVTDAKEVT